MQKIFAPGCALILYKPHLAEKLHLILNENIGKTAVLSTCCRHDPQFTSKTIKFLSYRMTRVGS